MECSDSLVSCGVYELHGLNSDYVEPGLVNALTSYFGDSGRGYFPNFFIFSDIVRRSGKLSGGQALAKYILDNGLGEVHTSPIKKNTNSDNRIALWTWVVSHRALHRWRKNKEILTDDDAVDMDDDGVEKIRWAASKMRRSF